MTTSFLSLFLLTVFVIFNLANCNLGKYTRCVSKKNLKGICVKVFECESVMKQIETETVKANPPAVCNYKEKTVCCPFNGLVGTFKEENLSSRIETKESIIITVVNEHQEMKREPLELSKRIADQKCKEYGDAVVETSYAAFGLLGGLPYAIKTSRCLYGSVPLVFGGQEAMPYEFPHQVMLGYRCQTSYQLKWMCGGSLISPNFVLTAAHCLYVKNFGSPDVVKLGMVRRNEKYHQTVEAEIQAIYPHSSYFRNLSQIHADIALLKLARKIKINKYILPICLPITEPNVEKAIVTGFGNTEHGRTDKLMKATLQKFSHKECQQKFRSTRVNKYSEICYGHRRKEIDSCNGDSGGPLQVSSMNSVNCTYTQIGIVSYGMPNCGTVGVPGVYTNVYHYLDWIVNIVWKDEIHVLQANH